MENKTSTNHENGNDANRLLVAGDIVVVNFLKGSYVIRTTDHDVEIMNNLYKKGNMRMATKEEREYWCHAYVQDDLYGVNINGLTEWLQWRESVACH